jgi:MFS family permease
MIGTFLEYFDLMLYVHMASILNDVFFDTTSGFNEKYGAAFAFCSTFLLKPFGGFFMGYLGDKYGRKSVLIFSTSIMALCCLVIANLPPYAQIGISASITLTLCRLIQGFASIGETTSSEIYMAENLSPPKRYFSTALIAYAGVLGMAFALFIAKLIITFNLNWRAVFWIGSIIAIIGYRARRVLHESPEFLSAKQKLLVLLKIDQNTKKGRLAMQDEHLSPMLIVSPVRAKFAYFCAFCGWPVCFYFSYVYCGDILKQDFNFTKEMVIHHNFNLSLFNIVGLFGWVYLTNFIHPLKLLKFKLFFYVPFLCSVPFLLTIAESSSLILFIQIIGIVLGNSTIPAKGVFLMHFGTLERFKYSAFLNGLSHVALYIATSFGLSYFRNKMGNYGILCISLPATLAFAWGVKEFIRMEKKTGDYYIDFKTSQNELSN